jgi:hypothetical protein
MRTFELRSSEAKQRKFLIKVAGSPRRYADFNNRAPLFVKSRALLSGDS